MSPAAPTVRSIAPHFFDLGTSQAFRSFGINFLSAFTAPEGGGKGHAGDWDGQPCSLACLPSYYRVGSPLPHVTPPPASRIFFV